MKKIIFAICICAAVSTLMLACGKPPQDTEQTSESTEADTSEVSTTEIIDDIPTLPEETAEDDGWFIPNGDTLGGDSLSEGTDNGFFGELGSTPQKPAAPADKDWFTAESESISSGNVAVSTDNGAFGTLNTPKDIGRDIE